MDGWLDGWLVGWMEHRMLVLIEKLTGCKITSLSLSLCNLTSSSTSNITDY